METAEQTHTATMTGSVKFFNADKGYGFIKPDGGGGDVFFHISALTDSGLSSLSTDQKVSFESRPDKRGKGPVAFNLKLID